ncbi:DUF5654 family protein [Nitrosopumilus sp.]|uniref:DUF5654 family protein n=1 Tax=Nitrosopumilus sp. TaxID=2024843 RepID=UPI00247DC5E0|nr:DUF5654 family protein [Nitrosopumilus sp.]MCV0431386.1 DUF5654 family protein [Nitrosopumilus sp.]
MADEEQKETSIKFEILDKIAALIAAAFGLVAALAWNDAIKALFREVFGTTDQLGAMLAYAILVTVIAVILTIFVARAASKAKQIISKTYKCSLCDYKTEIQSKFMEHVTKEHSANEDKFLSK